MGDGPTATSEDAPAQDTGEAVRGPVGGAVASRVTHHAPRPRAHAFVSLRHRDFRLLTTGLALAIAGYWALVIAQGWLVVQLTDSKLILGLVNASLSLPFLFVALPAGVIADRVNRQRLMTITRGFATAMMALLSALTIADLINVPLLALIVFATGCSFALDLPTRQSLVPELVEPDEITNAIAVNQLVFNGTTVLGPTLGGLVLSVVGPGGAFLLTALGNLALIVMVQRMRFPVRTPRTEQRSVRREMSQGIGYVARNPVLQPLMLLGAGLSILAQPYQSFLPAIAKDILHIGAGRLGLLFAAGGTGSIVGALTVAALGDIRRKGRVVIGAILLFGLLIVALGSSRTLPLTLVLLGFAGLAGSLSGTLTNTIMVMAAPAELRGRVMSVNVFAFGLAPFGNLLLGALADARDIPTALAFGGLTLAGLALLTALTRPRLRSL